MCNFIIRFSIVLVLVCAQSIFSFCQFSPLDIGGVQMWVRADSGITLNGNYVAQWDDQSGNNNHCTSQFDVIRPTLMNSAINEFPAISFDGIEDFLEFPLIGDVRTVFWVMRENPAATGVPPRPLLGWTGGLSYLRGNTEEFWDANFSDSAVHSGSTRLNMQSIDGTQTTFPNTFCISSLVTTGPVNATHLTMESNIYGRTWWGEIAEVIIYNIALGESDIALVENYLADKYAPEFVALNDINLPYSFCDTLLCALDGFESYQWNNADNSQCIHVDEEGLHTLRVTDTFGRSFYDTVAVFYPGILNIPNTLICSDDSFVWDTALSESDYTFAWSNSTFESTVSIELQGDYSLTVSDTVGCTSNISFQIDVDTFSESATLGNNLDLCDGNNIGLILPFENLQYLWSTNEETESITINNSGDYWLQATNENNCVMRDTIHIEVIGLAPEISFDMAGACQDATTNFTANNMSLSNIALWQWDFGDAQNAAGQNVAHTYTTAGNFEVTLVATTVEGCSQTFLQTIHIYQKPIAQFITSIACNNAPIDFDDTSVSPEGEITSWQWLIDGAFYAGQNVQALLPESGFQNVFLEVTTEHGCTDEISQAVIVLGSPTVAFVVDNTCVGALANFAQQVDDTQSGEILNYAWNFGDGTGSTQPNPAHFFAQANGYEVTLIANAINGCRDTLTQEVVIFNLPNADFTVGNACVDQLYQLDNTSTASIGDSVITWYWDINESFYEVENPQIIFTDVGLHPISLSATTENGCTSTVQQQIPVWPIPVANFSFEPEIGEAPFDCQFINESTGATDAYWFFGDTYESSEYNPLHVFTLTGTAYTQLVAISTAGCRDTTGQIITISKPILDVMIQTVQCTQTDFGQQITMQLINTGNVKIDQLILSYQVGNNAPVLEVWNGTLLPSNAITYVFNAYMQLQGQQFPYVCMMAETSPIEFTETNLTDNQYCKPLEDSGLEVFPPYPNPGDDRMFVRFVTPTAGDLVLHVFDITGKMVIDLEDEGVPKGYHQYFLDISTLADGNYKLQLEMNTAKSTVAFMKIKVQ